MQPLAIVTDSTSDIPDELIAQHHIHVVPNYVVIDGESAEDGKGMTREAFYTKLPTMISFPTTATASSGTYQQLYNRLLQEGFKQILSIHASSLLSGIFNAASVAAQPFSKQIHVIDSKYVTLGLGFQVLAAAELALTDPLDNILTVIENVRQRIRVVALLDTLEYVRRSGRVSWARARIGDLLHIKPLVEIRAGRILSLGQVRTRRNGIERLVDMLRNLGNLERLAILHTNAKEEAQRILDSQDLTLSTNPFCVNVTPVIGAHTGPNALGFAAVVR